MPTVGQYCTRTVVTARPSDGVLEIARLMRDNHVGCVVVVHDNGVNGRVPVGIVTDRDIVIGLLAQTDRQLQHVRADDIMTTKLTVASASDDLSDTLLHMRSAGVRRVPVLARSGELLGLLSFDDVLEYVQDEVSDLASLLKTEISVERRAHG